jgi:hypothetical protein
MPGLIVSGDESTVTPKKEVPSCHTASVSWANYLCNKFTKSDIFFLFLCDHELEDPCHGTGRARSGDLQLHVVIHISRPSPSRFLLPLHSVLAIN